MSDVAPADPDLPGTLAALIIGFVAVGLASIVGIMVRPSAMLALTWPANAAMLGLLLRYPRRLAPLAIGGIAANVAIWLAVGPHSIIVLSAKLGAAVSVIVAYQLCCRLPPAVLRMRHPQALLRLELRFAAAAALAAGIGAWAEVGRSSMGYAEGWLCWFSTELMAYTILLPVFLTVPAVPRATTTERRRPRTRRARLRALWRTLGPASLVGALPALGVLATCLVLILLPGVPDALLLMLPMPALLWSALSYGIFSSAVLTMLFGVWGLLAVGPGGALYLSEALSSRPSVLAMHLAVALVGLGPLAVASVMASRDDLIARMQRLADHDELSGLLNRRAFHERTARALRQGAGEGIGNAMLMLDIDHFKSVNDVHGHAAGDTVLAAFAQRTAGCLRDSDLFGRVGGEEFAVFLPRCTRPQAEALAERIRSRIDQRAVLVDGRPLHITVSLGVCVDGGGRMDIEALMRRADRALYVAKRAGRNRVSVDGTASTTVQAGLA